MRKAPSWGAEGLEIAGEGVANPLAHGGAFARLGALPCTGLVLRADSEHTGRYDVRSDGVCTLGIASHLLSEFGLGNGIGPVH